MNEMIRWKSPENVGIEGDRPSVDQDFSISVDFDGRDTVYLAVQSSHVDLYIPREDANKIADMLEKMAAYMRSYDPKDDFSIGRRRREEERKARWLARPDKQKARDRAFLEELYSLMKEMPVKEFELEGNFYGPAPPKKGFHPLTLVLMKHHGMKIYGYPSAREMGDMYMIGGAIDLYKDPPIILGISEDLSHEVLEENGKLDRIEGLTTRWHRGEKWVTKKQRAELRYQHMLKWVEEKLRAEA